MTDRYDGVLIAFKESMREDDLEDLIKLLNQIELIAGAEVTPTGIPYETSIARMKLRQEFFDLSHDFFWPGMKK